MTIYTIGFTKKSAAIFFGLLHEHEVRWVLDVRLHPDSQLAGFARKRDLPYFLDSLVKAKYSHELSLAPSEDLFKAYRKGEVAIEKYKEKYLDQIYQQHLGEHYLNLFNESGPVCLLCSEEDPGYCHRSWLAEAFQKQEMQGLLEIEHLR